MTYAKLPGLTWDGTVYENEEMGTLEALLPTGGYPTAQAPAMAELPDSTLLWRPHPQRADPLAVLRPGQRGVGHVYCTARPTGWQGQYAVHSGRPLPEKHRRRQNVGTL